MTAIAVGGSRRFSGSTRATDFHMALCDGSVHLINYTIDLSVHAHLGNRGDGYTIDGKKF